MKKMLPLFAVLLFCFNIIQAQTRKYDHTIAILENVMPTEDSCLPHDFFIVREGDKYTLLFYTKQSKGKKVSRVVIQDDTAYTHVSYKWLSGNKAAVRMFDANSIYFFEFKVMGYKCGSGIEYYKVDDNSSHL